MKFHAIIVASTFLAIKKLRLYFLVKILTFSKTLPTVHGCLSCVKPVYGDFISWIQRQNKEFYQFLKKIFAKFRNFARPTELLRLPKISALRSKDACPWEDACYPKINQRATIGIPKSQANKSASCPKINNQKKISIRSKGF